jgi:hypothetical protein
MRLYEFTQIVDEGPRQDRAAELFAELKPVFDAEGPKAFRRKVLDTLVAEFGMSMANASNVYNDQMKKSGYEGLSNAERRAAAGKEPVKPRTKRDAIAAPDMGAISSEIPPADVPMSDSDEDSVIKAIIADCDKLGGIDNPEGYTDEDDIEWSCSKDGDNIVLEWNYQYNRSSAVDAIKQNRDEVTSANNRLADIGKKYRDRVISYAPATMERAVKDDERFKGSPETVRRLRGKLELKLL